MTVEQLEERVHQLEKELRIARDIQEIQNVMSRHSFLDASNQTHQQIKELWAQKAPDVCSFHSQVREIGPESLNKIADMHDKIAQDHIEQIHRLFPDIPKENQELAGWMKMHTLCSPCIVVAGDGKTAKGTWESPGFATMIKDGELQAVWMWERFAVDFIKEDGSWKIWHFNAMSQFTTPFEKSWVTSSQESGTMGPRGLFPGHEPELPALSPVSNEPYNPRKLCGPLSPNFPVQPVPYETFGETFSYGPQK
jgi:hypothetical protein